LCGFFLAGSFFFLATGFFTAAGLAWVAVVWVLVPPQPATASAATIPMNSVRLTDFIPFS
jgi:hypothetical protein